MYALALLVLVPGCRLATRAANAITGAPPPTPAAAPALHAISLALGTTHTCAAMDDGSARCWGGNELGQLGDGTNEARAQGVVVPGVDGVTQVAAGADRSCARTADGRVRCWGADWDTLADGRLSPNVQIDPADVVPLSGLASLTLYRRRACGVTAAGEVRCTRASEFLGLGAAADGGVARTDDASALTAVVSPLVRIPGLSNVVQLAMGETHSCARLRDGTVRCWGNNQGGQLAAESLRLSIANPTTVPGLDGVRELAAAGAYSCAVVAGGTVRCWGTNPPGLTPRNSEREQYIRSPTAVAGLRDVVELALSVRYACARTSDGTARCWGENDHGQLGDGTTVGKDAPTPVTGLSNIAQLVVGAEHSCARLGDGSVRCWGRNADGELGDGTRADRALPVAAVLQP